MTTLRIGVDVGGTGIKGALVDVETGQLVSERVRAKTPKPAVPGAVAEVVQGVVSELGLEGPVGLGFPSVIKGGKVFTANNIDSSWIGVNAGELFAAALDRHVEIRNDADTAGLAEATFGAARDVDGLVVVLTFGTGIGSALVYRGALIPNIELGQLELGGVRPAELKYSAKAREDEGLEWEEWGPRANEFLKYVESLLTPDLMVFGGGAAKRWDRFKDQIDPSLPLVPAEMRNNAGIVGAALLVRG